MTQWPKYVKISKDIMKFVTDQHLKNYKLKFIRIACGNGILTYISGGMFCWNGLLKNSYRNFINEEV